MPIPLMSDNKLAKAAAPPKVQKQGMLRSLLSKASSAARWAKDNVFGSRLWKYVKVGASAVPGIGHGLAGLMLGAENAANLLDDGNALYKRIKGYFMPANPYDKGETRAPDNPYSASA